MDHPQIERPVNKKTIIILYILTTIVLGGFSLIAFAINELTYHPSEFKAFPGFTIGYATPWVDPFTLDIRQSGEGGALLIGDKIKLQSTFHDMQATKLVYRVEDEKVLSVDPEGNVTGLSEGRTRIVAETPDKKYANAYDIAVYNKIETVNAPKSITLKQGEVFDPKITTSPAGGKVIWYNFDSISYVKEDGEIVGVEPGNGKIFAIYGTKMGETTQRIFPPGDVRFLAVIDVIVVPK